MILPFYSGRQPLPAYHDSRSPSKPLRPHFNGCMTVSLLYAKNAPVSTGKCRNSRKQIDMVAPFITSSVSHTADTFSSRRRLEGGRGEPPLQRLPKELCAQTLQQGVDVFIGIFDLGGIGARQLDKRRHALLTGGEQRLQHLRAEHRKGDTLGQAAVLQRTG